MSFGRSMHLRCGSFSGKLRKRHSRAQSSKAAFNALKRGSRTAKQRFNALRAFNAAELRFFLRQATKAA